MLVCKYETALKYTEQTLYTSGILIEARRAPSDKCVIVNVGQPCLTYEEQVREPLSVENQGKNKESKLSKTN